MPSGKVHSLSTLILSSALAYAGYRAGYSLVPQVAALAGGCMVGLVLTPDLDVNGGSISQAHMRRAGGCVLGAAWSLSRCWVRSSG